MKKTFITGLLFLLPVSITVWVFFFLLHFFTRPFIGHIMRLIPDKLVQWKWHFISGHDTLRYGTEILLILFMFTIIVSIGSIARSFFLDKVLKMADAILKKTPLVNKVYKTSKEIIKTLLAADKKSFKQVVMVPFPETELYCLGLVSRQAPEACLKATKERLISIFVPSAPNPATGFTVMYREEEIIYLDMKAHEAVKFIVSCGMILPEKLSVTHKEHL